VLLDARYVRCQDRNLDLIRWYEV